MPLTVLLVTCLHTAVCVDPVSVQFVNEDSPAGTAGPPLQPRHGTANMLLCVCVLSPEKSKPVDQLSKHILLHDGPASPADPRQTTGPPTAEEEGQRETEGGGLYAEGERERERERESTRERKGEIEVEKGTRGFSLIPCFHLCLWRAFLFLLLKKQQHLVSSATSTSALAVIGALECPAVGSSVFSSPLVELIT